MQNFLVTLLMEAHATHHATQGGHHAVVALLEYIRSWGWHPKGWFVGATESAHDELEQIGQLHNPRKMMLELDSDLLAGEVVHEMIGRGLNPVPKKQRRA